MHGGSIKYLVFPAVHLGINATAVLTRNASGVDESGQLVTGITGARGFTVHAPSGQPYHANNMIAGLIIPFLVLGFWDKNSYAPLPCHVFGIFLPLPGCRHFKF